MVVLIIIVYVGVHILTHTGIIFLTVVFISIIGTAVGLVLFAFDVSYGDSER